MHSTVNVEVLPDVFFCCFFLTEKHYKDVWQELPEDWLDGLNISKQVLFFTIAF